MTIDLATLERLLAAGTARPWRVEYDDRWSRPGGERRVTGVYAPDTTEDFGAGPENVQNRIIETDGGHYEPRQPDADLIVAAVNALPALLRIARAAEAFIEATDSTLDEHNGSAYQRRENIGDAERELRAALSSLDNPEDK